MQRHEGTEWLDNGLRKDFYYYEDSRNSSSPDFASAVENCDWASGGIIGILTDKSFYWTDDHHISRHSALAGATGQKSIARLETKENRKIYSWATEKSHLKNFTLLLSMQHLPADLIFKLFSVSDYHQSQNTTSYFYGEFRDLYKAIPKIK